MFVGFFAIEAELQQNYGEKEERECEDQRDYLRQRAEGNVVLLHHGGPYLIERPSLGRPRERVRNGDVREVSEPLVGLAHCVVWIHVLSLFHSDVNKCVFERVHLQIYYQVAFPLQPRKKAGELMLEFKGNCVQ